MSGSVSQSCHPSSEPQNTIASLTHSRTNNQLFPLSLFNLVPFGHVRIKQRKYYYTHERQFDAVILLASPCLCCFNLTLLL